MNNYIQRKSGIIGIPGDSEILLGTVMLKVRFSGKIILLWRWKHRKLSDNSHKCGDVGQEVSGGFTRFDEHEHVIIQVVTDDHRGMHYQHFEEFYILRKYFDFILTLFSSQNSRQSDNISLMF